MNLTVDKEKKKYLQKMINKNNTGTKKFFGMSKIFFIFGIISGIVEFHFPFLIHNSNRIRIPGSGILMFLILSVSSFFTPMFINRFYCSSRRKEELIVSDDIIQYKYKIRDQIIFTEKHLITIKFSEIDHIEYNSETEKIELFGKFADKCIYNSKDDELSKPAEIEYFVIHDYFEDSIKDIFESKNIEIIKE